MFNAVTNFYDLEIMMFSTENKFFDTEQVDYRIYILED